MRSLEEENKNKEGNFEKIVVDVINRQNEKNSAISIVAEKQGVGPSTATQMPSQNQLVRNNVICIDGGVSRKQ